MGYLVISISAIYNFEWLISWYFIFRLILLCWKCKVSFYGISLFILISLLSLFLCVSSFFPSCFLFSLRLYQVFMRLLCTLVSIKKVYRFVTFPFLLNISPSPIFFLPLSTSFFSSSCLSSLKKFMDEISREIFAIFNVFTRT